MSDLWIVIPNWPRFQHYKDRHVPWIKLYTELNSSDDWRDLTYAQRGLLVSIWIEYERSRGQLRCSSMPGRAGQKHRNDTMIALVQAGFIELSSRRTRARERGTSYPKEAGAANTANGAAPAEEKTVPPPADQVEAVRKLVEKVFEP